MHKQTNQMQRKTHGSRVVRDVVVVGMVMLCFVALCLTASHSHVYASGTGSASSGPSTGPVGTTIAVNGTGWSEADGTQASFGYIINSNTDCSIVADSQIGILHGGKFNGWFRWPQGTPLGTYTVCVTVATTIGIAGSFTVLSSIPPQVTISPYTLTEKQQATVTATNYFPAGMTVNFSWVSTSNHHEFNLNSAVSDSNGTATVTFTVPVTSMASGSYMIEAIGGSGQPPTLYSSVNLTYNAPAVQPSPTPSATPSPSPTPTQAADPTPTNTSKSQASATAGATLTPVGTQNIGGNSTPTTNTTSGSNGGTTSSPGTLFLVAAVVGTLFLLTAILIIALIVRRRRSEPIAVLTQPPVIPPVLAGGAGQLPWSRPQGIFANNGSMPPSGMTPLPLDPTLEVMRRQAQSGLFALPRPRLDEVSIK